MTSLYTAIMQAADHIERHPELWEFHKYTVPECGTPGCAIGWIGHFAGRSVGEPVGFASEAVLGIDEADFYDRMWDLIDLECSESWRDSPADVAKHLRLYAEKYHGHEKAPDWNALASAPLVADTVRSQELVS